MAKKIIEETTVISLNVTDASVEALALDAKASLIDTFNIFWQDAFKLIPDAEKIEITDISQVEEMKQAKELRKKLQAIRIEAEKTRVILKEDSLMRGRAIDAIAGKVKDLIKPIEDRLEEQEKFVERKEEMRLANLLDVRFREVVSYGADPLIYNLKTMSDEAYTELCTLLKERKEKRDAEIAKVEVERQAKAQAEIEARKQLEAENAKLQAEVEKTNAKLIADQKIAIAKLAAERAAKEKAEAELTAKQEAEKREIEAREAKVREQEALAAKIAHDKATAPDKEKMKALAEMFLHIEYPEMTTAEGKYVLDNVKGLAAKVNAYIIKNVESL